MNMVIDILNVELAKVNKLLWHGKLERRAKDYMKYLHVKRGQLEKALKVLRDED